MKVSEQWLREWVNPAIGSNELVEQLTMAGLEVDGIQPVAGKFSGVIVAQVMETGRHPDADKLSVCRVYDGQKELQIVCGAPNVRPGLKVALAQVGGILPGDFKIKKAKLRGAESFGMLCSEVEIGLSDDADEIMELADDAPVGTDLRTYLQLDDNCIEIDLTPNRGDCLGIAGLAREIGVLNRIDVAAGQFEPIENSHDAVFPVDIEDRVDCPRYAGRVIRNINVQATTPVWMKEKLRRSGIRSIAPVVDVTNYVLLELGQPMHAFDLAKLNNGITVRNSRSGESLLLLDGQTIDLEDETLVIADQSGPIAMAGIMGGTSTSVTDDTRDIFLESAHFNPIKIAGRARKYGLHTDSSHRFERGVDFELQKTAIERATRLLIDIVGGEPGPVIDVVSRQDLPARPSVVLRKDRVSSILSLDLEDEEITDILTRLGFTVDKPDDNSWRVQVPSYRFDISIEADLIEEIARVYGYNRLPVSIPSAQLAPGKHAETQVPLKDMRKLLLARGYFEAITYSFVDPDTQSLFDNRDSFIALANPISSDMAVMRTSLWPGLIRSLQYNQNRQQGRVRLFETGLTFKRSDADVEQTPKLAGVIFGQRLPEGWAHDKGSVDFFDIKGDVEALLSIGGNENSYRFEPVEHPALHPGQSAQVICEDDRVAGCLGALHPAIEKTLDVAGPVYLFELDSALISQGKLAEFKELSKYPEIRRDLAIIVDKSIRLTSIVKAIKEVAGEWLTDMTVFDQYEGQGIAEGRKSLALGLTWQNSSRTLKDDEISLLVGHIINNLKKQFNVELRGE